MLVDDRVQQIQDNIRQNDAFRAARRIPKRLMYNTVRPLGIAARMVQQRYNPSSANNQINPGDLVRFLINTPGYWDPYKCWHNIEVRFGGTAGEGIDDGVVYQVDGSAQSFILNHVEYNRGVEISRHQNYPHMASFLYDVQYPIHKRHTHQAEGIGYANYNNNTYGTIQGGLQPLNLDVALYAGVAWRAKGPPAALYTPAMPIPGAFGSRDFFGTATVAAGVIATLDFEVVDPVEWAGINVFPENPLVNPYTSLCNSNKFSSNWLNNATEDVPGHVGVYGAQVPYLIYGSNPLTLGASLDNSIPYQLANGLDMPVPTYFDTRRLPFPSGLPAPGVAYDPKLVNYDAECANAGEQIVYNNKVVPGGVGLLSAPNPMFINGVQINQATPMPYGCDWMYHGDGSNQVNTGVDPLIAFDYITDPANPGSLTFGFSRARLDPLRANTYSNDQGLKCITGLYGTDATLGLNVSIAQSIFRQNGVNGVDIIGDADAMAGATNKQLFNYALSNANWEPMFTNGGVLYMENNGQPPFTPTFAYTGVWKYFPREQLPISSTWTRAPDQWQHARPTIASGQSIRDTMNCGAFSMPLLSGTFGVLMPEEFYKLQPMVLYPELIFEYQVNPWAIITSGYPSNRNGKDNQPRRLFTITRWEIVSEQYVFDRETDGLIMQGYNAGQSFFINTRELVSGPTFQIYQNQIPMTVQINQGFDSLCAIFWMFVPMDYNNYSWCRQTTRLSHNITKYQLHIGTDYYPSIPMLANAGNVLPLPNTSTTMWKHPNTEYVTQLYKCFGKYMDLNEDSFVNQTNFAPNDICFAPDNGPTTSVANPDSWGNTRMIESFCQWGYPLLHQNRFRPAAVFGQSTQTMIGDSEILSGISTMDVRPFELALEYEPDVKSTFKRNSMMVIFMEYDLLLEVSRNGIRVLGRS